MRAEEKLLRAINTIEYNLCTPITLEKIASSANVSVRQLQRLFSDYTDSSILHYVNARRLTEASKKLVTSQHRIIDIAMEFQFSTHESFTRSFSREFSLSPSKFRERAHTYHSKQTLKINDNILSMLKNGLLGTPRIVFMPTKKIVGFKLDLDHGDFSTPENHLKAHQSLTDLCHIVDMQCQQKSKHYWISQPHLQDIPRVENKDDNCWCFIGAETQVDLKKIYNMKTYNIPRSKYAVFFQHTDKICSQEHSQLKNFCDHYAKKWLQQHNYSISSQPWLQRILSHTPYMRELYVPLIA